MEFHRALLKLNQSNDQTIENVAQPSILPSFSFPIPKIGAGEISKSRTLDPVEQKKGGDDTLCKQSASRLTIQRWITADHGRGTREIRWRPTCTPAVTAGRPTLPQKSSRLRFRAGDRRSPEIHNVGQLTSLKKIKFSLKFPSKLASFRFFNVAQSKKIVE